MNTEMTISRVMKLAMLLSLALVPALAWAQAGGEPSASPNPSSGSASAVVSLSHPSQPAQINLNTINGGVTVRGYAGHDVIIESAGQPLRQTGAPEEVKGMTRLTTGGLNVDEDNNVVTIHGGLSGGHIELKVPAESSLSVKSMSGNIDVEGVSGEFDIENVNGAIALIGVSGSIVAHTMNGPITANVTRLDPSKPSSFNTLNGRIDLALPADLRANLIVTNDSGDTYLDQGFDFKPLPDTTGGSSHPEPKGSTSIRLGGTIRGTINGGGTEICIRSFNGTILIHKGK